MKVDLDQYREPANAPETMAARREALLDQLGWLADEAEALAPLLGTLPAWALEQTPLPGERSVNATLAHLAALDRTVHPGWLDQLLAEDEPTWTDEALDGSPEGAVETLLDELRAARAAFIARVEAVPEADWTRTGTLNGEPAVLYDLLLRIVRRDADALRTLAYRLNEAKWSDSAS